MSALQIISTTYFYKLFLQIISTNDLYKRFLQMISTNYFYKWILQMISWFHDSMIPWFYDSIIPWFHDSMIPWFHDSMILFDLRQVRHMRISISTNFKKRDSLTDMTIYTDAIAFKNKKSLYWSIFKQINHFIRWFRFEHI